MNPADLATGAQAVTSEVSLWGMFWSAHFVVKLVMLGLLGASFWCWSIIVDKTLLFSRVQKSMDQFEEQFWSGNSLEDLYSTLSQKPTTGMGSLFVAAMREWKRSFSGATSAFVRRRRNGLITRASASRGSGPWPRSIGMANRSRN